MSTRTIGTTLALLSTLLGVAVPARAQDLRRDLGSYFVLSLKTLRLKNMIVDGSCNVGVDCQMPASGNKACGSVRMQAATFADGSQLVGDQVFFTKPGANIFQLFRNGGGSLANATIASPPVQPFTTPVLPGTCDASCTADVSAIAALCGFPVPFPACNSGAPVNVEPGQDCPGDTSPGNGRCDLPPGVYGALNVRSKAKLTLAAGSYSFCSMRIVRSTLVLGNGTTITVPNGGAVRISNESTFGQKCGDITLLIDGPSTIRFGHAVNVAARVCAPEGKIALGHGNHLLGQFVGDFVTSDRGNDGDCCGASCACVDGFDPTTAAVGATVTFTSHCDLSGVTAVKICGIGANITSKSTATMTVTVPTGATGPCSVEIDSSSGKFVTSLPLLVP